MCDICNLNTGTTACTCKCKAGWINDSGYCDGCGHYAIKSDRDIVVKVDFFTWETMPEPLKEIALKQGFVPPKENEIIAVKTLMTKQEIKEVK